MNQKKARMLRKAVGYDPGEDPIVERKYSTLLTVRKNSAGQKMKTGHMLATKGERLLYRQAKKLYREGKI